MRAFSHSEFLAHASKVTGKAYMLVTVDEDLIDQNLGAAERNLTVFSDDAMHKITTECGTIIEFGDIDDASTVFYTVERSLSKIPNIGLFVAIYYEGYSILNICQSHEVRSLIEQQNYSSAVM